MENLQAAPGHRVFANLVDPQPAIRAAMRLQAATRGRRYGHWNEPVVEVVAARTEPAVAARSGLMLNRQVHHAGTAHCR